MKTSMNVNVKDFYNLEGLEIFYRQLLTASVPICPIRDLPIMTRGIVLRHDADLDLDSSLAVAELEHKLGIQSTYYVLLTSRFYNPHCKHSQNILHKLLSMGHEVGLHLNTALYPKNKLLDAFAMERHTLETIIGQEILSLSLHNPSVNNEYPRFDGVVNAYNWDIFSPSNYFSDSFFKFSTSAKEILFKANSTVVQILLHPELYCIRDDGQPPSIIHIASVETQRFGNALLELISTLPIYWVEIRNYPTDYLNIKVTVR